MSLLLLTGQSPNAPGGTGTVTVDASSPAQVVTATNTTASISTAAFSPPANTVIAVAISSNSSAAAQTFTVSSTGTALTWVKAKQQDFTTDSSSGSASAVYYAVNASAQSGITVAVSVSDTTNARHAVRVLVLNGVDTATPTGSTAGATPIGTGTFSVSLTRTRTGSLAVAASSDWTANGAPTGGTVTNQQTYTNADLSGSTGYLTLGSAGANTVSFTGYAAAAAGKIVGVEFLPSGTVPATPTQTVTFVGAGTPSAATGPNATATPTLPDNLQYDDLLVLVVGAYNDTSSAIVPYSTNLQVSTFRTYNVTSGTTGVAAGWGTTIYRAGVVASTVTIDSNATATGTIIAYYLAYRNVDLAALTEIGNAAANSINSHATVATTTSPPQAALSAGGGMAIALVAAQDAIGPFTVPSGWTAATQATTALGAQGSMSAFNRWYSDLNPTGFAPGATDPPGVSTPGALAKSGVQLVLYPARKPERNTTGVVTIRGSSESSSLTDNNLVIPKPLGTSQGDMLLAVVADAQDADITTMVPTDGYAWTGQFMTAVGQGQAGGAGGFIVYTRMATASEPTEYSFATGVKASVGGIIAFSGAYEPYVAVSQFQSSGSAVVNHTVPSVPVEANSRLVSVLFTGGTSNDYRYHAPPTGMTPRVRVRPNNAGGWPALSIFSETPSTTQVTPPTLVATYGPATGVMQTLTTGSTSVTMTAGDLLVCTFGGENGTIAPSGPPTGGGITWTQQVSIGSGTSQSHQMLWTATAPTTQTATLSWTVPNGGTSGRWHYEFQRWTGAGFGTIASAAASTGTLAITTTRDNSGVAWMSTDWNAGDGATRSYLMATAGTHVETGYRSVPATDATWYNGYYPNTGATGAKAIGVMLPQGQIAAMAAVEILGTVTTGNTTTGTRTAESRRAVNGAQVYQTNAALYGGVNIVVSPITQYSTLKAVGVASASLTGTVAAPSIATLTDDFTTANSTKWVYNAAASVSGGQLVETPNTSYTGQIDSVTAYDLTGSAAFVQLAQRPNVGNGGIEAYLQIDVGSTINQNNIGWNLTGSTLTAFRRVGGVWTAVTSLTYSAASHQRFRVRESGGSIFWDTYDGSTWTQRGTWVQTWSVTSMKVHIGTGYGGTEPSPGTAIWDDFNIAPPVSSTVAAVATATASLGTSFVTEIGTLAASGTTTADLGTSFVTETVTLAASGTASATVSDAAAAAGSYRAGALMNNGITATTGSMTVTIPSAAQVGDVAVAHMLTSALSVTEVFTASGWTQRLGPDDSTAASNTFGHVFTKTIASGDPGSSVTFTHTNNRRMAGTLTVWAGVTETGLSSGTLADGSAGTTADLPTVASVQSGAAVIALFGRRSAVATQMSSVTVPSGYTAADESRTNIATAGNIACRVGYKIAATPGSYGGETATTVTDTHTGVDYLFVLPAVVSAPTRTSTVTATGTGTASLGTSFVTETTTLAASGTTTASLGTSFVTKIATVAATGAATASLGTAFITESGTLAAAAVTSASVTAAVTVQTTLAATATGTATVDGTSTPPIQTWTSAVDAKGTATASLGTAFVTVTSSLAASAVATATITGVRTQPSAIAAAGVGTATITGFLTISGTLAATAIGTAAVTTAITRVGILAATGTTTASLGTAFVTVISAIAATATGTATISGFVTVTAAVAANGVATASVSGFDTISGTLAAIGTASATVSGFVTVIGTLAASGTATASITGVRTQFSAVSASGIAAAAITGFVTTSSSLTATGTTTASLTGFVTVIGTISASGTATATVTAAITVISAIAATGTATATITGVRTQPSAVSATGTGSASVTGFLTISGTLAATGIGSANIAVLGSVSSTVAASAIGTATITGFVTVTGSLAAVGRALATIIEAITRIGTITAAGQGTATVSGFVTKFIGVDAQAHASANLTGLAQLSALANAQAFGQLQLLGVLSQVTTLDAKGFGSANFLAVTFDPDARVTGNATVAVDATGTFAPARNRTSTANVIADAALAMHGPIVSLDGRASIDVDAFAETLAIPSVATVDVDGSATLARIIGLKAIATVETDAAFDVLLGFADTVIEATATLRVVQSLTTVLENGVPARLTREEEEIVAEPIPVYKRRFTVLR
jgi:hypothetical protein